MTVASPRCLRIGLREQRQFLTDCHSVSAPNCRIIPTNGGYMTQNRGARLQTRVDRLKAALAELKEAWTYVHSIDPHDTLRLGPIAQEIELAEAELDAAQHALKLHLASSD